MGWLVGVVGLGGGWSGCEGGGVGMQLLFDVFQLNDKLTRLVTALNM